LRPPPHVSLDWPPIEPFAARRGDSPGLERQRPALAGKPSRRLDAVPVGAERPRATELFPVSHPPAVRRHLAATLRVDERQIGSPRIAQEPYRPEATTPPVVDGAEPLVSEWRFHAW